ncbi:MAG: FG-GAP-like repeat-containing protein [Planctomycetota bacterium]|nr:FG-GAP-like repeat-containing protein [Planctomycetota bacterium]
MSDSLRGRFAAASVTLVLLGQAALAQLTVVSIDPPINAVNRPPNASIVIDFDRAVSAATLSEVEFYGNNSGRIAGTLALENADRRLRFTPARPYFAGEKICTSMSHDLRASDGTFLRQAGYTACFRVKASPASMTFTNIGSWFTDPGNFTRIYGGQMCDFNGDDYIDMAAVSEVSADVRMFRNLADGTGSFEHVPSNIVGVDNEPSPNENADLNGDQWIDMVTCNGNGGSVSVLLGNGPATFAPSVSYPMALYPHGLALLDCDGDGDIDIVTANTGSSNLTLRKNNGDGTFGPITSFEGGGDGEYSLAAEDMNNDGIVDLVCGLRFSQLFVVHRGNGDGTFTPQPSQSAGGQTWMIACGDIDGDGKVDVSSANSFSSSGSILRGNGNGTLQAPQVVPTGGHTNATDIADLDGDGDLDWVLSSFGAQEWRLYRNDAGVFNLVTSFPSNANPACASLADIDNDGDIDMIFWTETSDEIITMENGALDSATYCYGTAVSCPCANAGLAGHGCEHSFAIGGGLLNAQGRASVANDSVALVAGGLPPTASTLFFQGDGQVAGGAGQAFGDGLRCAGGAVIRLGTRSAVNGYVGYGAGQVGDVPVSIRGAVPPSGATRFYQGWYRNAASFCSASTFNLTNGVRVTWTP